MEKTLSDVRKKRIRRAIEFSVLLLIGLFLFLLLSQFSPGGDWQAVLQPSTQALLEGNNPYNEHRFLSPPWAFAVLIPPALLPPAQGSALFGLIGCIGYFLAFYRLRVTRIALALLVANPAFMAALLNPNFDWAVALGYTLPPQIGLFFVLTKPQIGAPLVLFWFVKAWRSGGYRRVLRDFAPVTLAYLLSVIVFGPWFLHMGGAVSSLSNTANVWPWGIIVGFALIVVSLRQQNSRLALQAGPLLSPYLAPYSWLPAMVVSGSDTILTLAVCVGFWIAWLITIS